MESTSPTENAGIRLVLASGSPRRRELLGLLGAEYEALSSDAEERDDPVPDVVLAALPPFHLPRATHPSLLAWRKASHAAALVQGAAILGADTIVVLDDEVLNKPRDPAHARQMLAQLSGRVHTVYTGLCVIRQEAGGRRQEAGGRRQETPQLIHFPPPTTCHLPPYEIWLDLVASDVEIAPLSPQVIADYVATGEPLDKAGAYGIQGLGGRLVRDVRGSYTAVVGLPLPHTHRLLRAAGVRHLHNPEQTYLRWLEQQGKEPLPCPPTLP